MRKGCIQCGDCCEKIALGLTLDQIKAKSDVPDKNFILEHWTPAEKPIAKRNALMSDKQFNGYYWYTCDLFDTKTRKCKDWENRPAICRNYPSRRHTNETLISSNCGFYRE